MKKFASSPPQKQVTFMGASGEVGVCYLHLFRLESFDPKQIMTQSRMDFDVSRKYDGAPRQAVA